MRGGQHREAPRPISPTNPIYLGLDGAECGPGLVRPRTSWSSLCDVAEIAPERLQRVTLAINLGRRADTALAEERNLNDAESVALIA